MDYKIALKELIETVRSEERRVGKECKTMWSRYDEKNNSAGMQVGTRRDTGGRRM